MVVEHLFPVKWFERKQHAFFASFLFTLFGLISAYFVFPASVGIVSITFTSILLIPTLGKILKLEEKIESREKRFSFPLLFKDHKDIFKVYIYTFFGVFAAYLIVGIFLSEGSLTQIFSTQLISGGIFGNATDGSINFGGLIFNNLIVFAICFILSIFYGAGSIIFLIWNASVWATTLAFLAKQTGDMGAGPVIALLVILLPILPHLFTEAVAYITAAIVGGVISRGVQSEKLFSPKFKRIMVDAGVFLGIGIVLIFIGALIEVLVF